MYIHFLFLIYIYAVKENKTYHNVLSLSIYFIYAILSSLKEVTTMKIHLSDVIFSQISAGRYRTPDNVQKWIDEHIHKIPSDYYLSVDSCNRCIRVLTRKNNSLVYSIDYDLLENSNVYYIMATLRYLNNKSL